MGRKKLGSVLYAKRVSPCLVGRLEEVRLGGCKDAGLVQTPPTEANLMDLDLWLEKKPEIRGWVNSEILRKYEEAKAKLKQHETYG